MYQAHKFSSRNVGDRGGFEEVIEMVVLETELALITEEDIDL